MNQHNRTSTLFALLLPLGAASLGCQADGPGEVNQIAAAASAPFASAPERERRANAIRAHFKARVDALPRVATTRTPLGQTIDWVHPHPEALKRVPPPPPQRPAGDTTPDGFQPTELEVSPSARGPAGTVPVVRFDVEDYLQKAVDLPENPADIMRKAPPPSPEGGGINLGYYYGAWRHEGTYIGTGGFINTWQPYVATYSDHSLMQEATFTQIGTKGQPGAVGQSVEAGAYKSFFFGNNQTVLFTFYTTNYWDTYGDWVSSYNAVYQGWQQVSSTKAPGVYLPATSSSGTSNQKEIWLHVRSWGGDWWVWVNDEWIGFYPRCKNMNYSNCSTLFSDPGLLSSAQRAYWYGEVRDGQAPTATATKMGSGEFASGGYGTAAYLRTMGYYDTAGSFVYWGYGGAYATDTACYTVSGPYYGLGPLNTGNWTNYYYLGGPGATAPGGGCH
jgi:hypothetical protein